MGKLLLPMDRLHLAPHQFEVFSDFEHLVTGDVWTSLAADIGASVATVDGVGGQLALTTGATDNNEAYVSTTREIFLFENNRPAAWQVRVKWAEAATDDLNFAFGVMNAVAADGLVDNAGGLKADFSGAAFYKVDGGTRLQAISSVATARTTTDLDLTGGGGQWLTLRIEFQPISATLGYITFLADPNGGQNLQQVLPYDRANLLVPRVQHSIVLGSATEMQLFVGAKAGGAASEVVTVDYLYGCQAR